MNRRFHRNSFCIIDGDEMLLNKKEGGNNGSAFKENRFNGWHKLLYVYASH